MIVWLLGDTQSNAFISIMIRRTIIITAIYLLNGFSPFLSELNIICMFVVGPVRNVLLGLMQKTIVEKQLDAFHHCTL